MELAMLSIPRIVVPRAIGTMALDRYPAARMRASRGSSASKAFASPKFAITGSPVCMTRSKLPRMGWAASTSGLVNSPASAEAACRTISSPRTRNSDAALNPVKRLAESVIACSVSSSSSGARLICRKMSPVASSRLITRI